MKDKYALLQNTIILVLSLLLLKWLCLFQPIPLPTLISTPPRSTTALTLPFRCSVQWNSKSTGSLSELTNGAWFQDHQPLLQDAFATAQNEKVVSSDEFCNALEDIGLYLDFTNDLPASLLSDTLGLTLPNGSPSVYRWILLTTKADASAVSLYLMDTQEQVWQYETALSAQELMLSCQENTLPLSLSFGWDTMPYLLSGDVPDTMILRAETPTLETEALLSAFDFNAHTNSRYVESNRTLVVIDASATLQLSPSGLITYQGTLDTETYQAGETVAEAIAASLALLQSPVYETAAVLVPASVCETPNGWELTFQYQVNGLPILPSNGIPAASVTVEDGKIRAFRLQLRQYSVTKNSCLLLPLAQLHSLLPDDAEPIFAYVDRHTEEVQTAWLCLKKEAEQ